MVFYERIKYINRFCCRIKLIYEIILFKNLNSRGHNIPKSHKEISFILNTSRCLAEATQQPFFWDHLLYIRHSNTQTNHGLDASIINNRALFTLLAYLHCSYICRSRLSSVISSITFLMFGFYRREHRGQMQEERRGKKLKLS